MAAVLIVGTVGTVWVLCATLAWLRSASIVLPLVYYYTVVYCYAVVYRCRAVSLCTVRPQWRNWLTIVRDIVLCYYQRRS